MPSLSSFKTPAVALLSASALLLAACGSDDEAGGIEAVDTNIHGLQAAGPGNGPNQISEGLDQSLNIEEYFMLISPEITPDDAVNWYKDKYEGQDLDDVKYLGHGEKKDTGKVGAWCWASDLEDENTEDTFVSLQVFDNSVSPQNADQSAEAGSNNSETIKEGITTEIFTMKIDSSQIQGNPEDICNS